MKNPEQVQDTKETKGIKEQDLFHHGVISKLFPSNNMGVVRTESGREIPFSFQLVVLLGNVKAPTELKEGQRIGYDLSWTSGGLRVTKIKTYSQPRELQGSFGSEGERGQGEDLPS